MADTRDIINDLGGINKPMNDLHAIRELLKNGTGSYSTSETKVGKWIDGKEIYQIVIVSTTPYTTGVFESIADISELNIDTLISLNLVHNLDVNGSIISFPAPYIHNNSTHISVYKNGDTIDFYCDNSDWNTFFKNNTIILQYTKV